MREGSKDNRRAKLLNPDRTSPDEAPMAEVGKDGYAVLSRARRGQPRQEMSDPLGYDEGPWNSISYPDL